MTVLYVLKSVAHFSYHESVIRYLCRSGHRVEVLFDGFVREGYSDRAVRAFATGTPGVTVGWLRERRGMWRRPLFVSRELLSYTNYLVRKEQSDFYRKRWEGYLPRPVRLAVKSAWLRKVLGTEGCRSLLRSVERLVPPDAGIVRSLRDQKPDVVVASPVNLRFSEEVEYVKAAVALGIPTVVPVLSWDNLTTKGLFHVIPDMLLAWNRAQVAEATRFHRIPADRIVITGAPFFDKWFDTAGLASPRDAFCREVGLHPDQPFVVYLGSSANIARDETWLVRELAEAFQKHPDPEVRRIAVLVRPHPANTRIYKDIQDARIRVWPPDGALPDSDDLLQEFRDTLRYAVAAIGINTSGMIDAVIADRPCVAMMADRYGATQVETVHFRYLLDADVLEIAKTPAECADLIEGLLAGSDPRGEARRRFVREFIRPRGVDRSAGEIAGRAIELVAQGKSAREVESALASSGLVLARAGR